MALMTRAYHEVKAETHRVHDQNRIKFLRDHIQWMVKAVDAGVGTQESPCRLLRIVTSRL